MSGFIRDKLRDFQEQIANLRSKLYNEKRQHQTLKQDFKVFRERSAKRELELQDALDEERAAVKNLQGKLDQLVAQKTSKDQDPLASKNNNEKYVVKKEVVKKLQEKAEELQSLVEDLQRPAEKEPISISYDTSPPPSSKKTWVFEEDEGDSLFGFFCRCH